MQATRQPFSQRRRLFIRRQRGFTLMEVALSLIIFTMMTLMFGAVLPIAVRGAKHGNNYSQAAALAQRKVDQLRAVGYGRLFDNSAGTAKNQLLAQNIINDQNGTSDPINGGSYDFTAIDHLTGNGGFFPPGSTGTIAISPYAGTPAGQMAQVKVTITWTGNVPGSYTVSALIISMSHK